MTSLGDEAHPKFLLNGPCGGAVQAVATGVVFSAIQLNWYRLAIDRYLDGSVWARED